MPATSSVGNVASCWETGRVGTKEIVLVVNVHPFVLFGGSVTRLWLWSHAAFPKQVLCLAGSDSFFFQQVTRRLAAFAADDFVVSAPPIASNEDRCSLAIEHMYDAGIDIGPALEPFGSNTAPSRLAPEICAFSAPVESTRAIARSR